MSQHSGHKHAMLSKRDLVSLRATRVTTGTRHPSARLLFSQSPAQDQSHSGRSRRLIVQSFLSTRTWRSRICWWHTRAWAIDDRRTSRHSSVPGNLAVTSLPATVVRSSYFVLRSGSRSRRCHWNTTPLPVTTTTSPASASDMVSNE